MINLHTVRGLDEWWGQHVLTIIPGGMKHYSLLAGSYKGSPKSRELRAGVSVVAECLA